MKDNFIFTNINCALPVLAEQLLLSDEIGSRAGRVKEKTFVGITLTQPYRREILIPERKASLPAQIAETMWVLAGRNDVDWLERYLPRARDFSDDGKTWRGGYGSRLRRWGEQHPDKIYPFDQLNYVVDLLKENPLERRAVMAIYDPATDSQPGKDIPCNNWVHFLNRNGELDMHVAIRSNDLIWGWSGINAFEWSAIQEIVAGILGINVGMLHFSISSLHIYDRHWERARKIAESHVPESFHQNRFNGEFARSVLELDRLIGLWFNVEQLIREDSPKTVEAIRSFPEPMLREWLNVIRWYWTGDGLQHVGPDAGHAARIGPKTPHQKADADRPEGPHLHIEDSFVARTARLHEEKDTAYGGSWKRRGEMLGVMANIARKIDRLGATDNHETAADTATDLLVYLVKYRLWLSEFAGAPLPFGGGWELEGLTDTAAPVTRVLKELGSHKNHRRVRHLLEDKLRKDFESLEQAVTGQHKSRFTIVNHMMRDAFDLAFDLDWKQGNAARSWNPEK